MNRRNGPTTLWLIVCLRCLVFCICLLHCLDAQQQSIDASFHKPPNYVILTTARSSSTMLCREISDHKDAECYGELMSTHLAQRYLDVLAGKLRKGPHVYPQLLKEGILTDGSGWRGGRSKSYSNFGPPKNLSVHSLRPIDTVRWLLQDELPDRTNLCYYGWHSEWCLTEEYRQYHKRLVKGFKVFYMHQDLAEAMQLCKELDLPVIHLIRASGFRRFVSQFVANRTQLYQRVDKRLVQQAREAAQNKADRVNLNKLKTFASDHDKDVHYWAKYLDDNGIRHMTIFYEELKMRKMYLPQKEVFRDVYEFLGLDPKRVRGKVPEVTYSSLLDYRSVITNMDELWQAYPFETCGLEYGSPFE